MCHDSLPTVASLRAWAQRLLPRVASGREYGQVFVERTASVRATSGGISPAGVSWSQDCGIGVLGVDSGRHRYRGAPLADGPWLDLAGQGLPSLSGDFWRTDSEDLRDRVEQVLSVAASSLPDGGEASRCIIDITLRGHYAHDSQGADGGQLRLGTRLRVEALSHGSGGLARIFERCHLAGLPDPDTLPETVAALHEAARVRASRSADARPAGRQASRVVLRGRVAGALLHEAVGHLAESDNALRGAVAGARLGCRLQIADDPTLLHGYGSVQVDDEGSPALATILVKDGERTIDHLSSKLANSRPGRPTSHGRRQNFRHPAIPRSCNLVVAPSADSSELVEDVEDVEDVDSDTLVLDGFGSAYVEPDTGDVTLLATDGTWRGEPVRDITIRDGVADVLAKCAATSTRVEAPDNLSCIKQGQTIGFGVVSPALLFEGLTWES